MSTTAKTIATFRTELEQQIGSLSRPLEDTLSYASTLETDNSEEEEEESVPPGEKRKKQVKPEFIKKGVHFREILTKALSSDLESAKETIEALLDYITELESQR